VAAGERRTGMRRNHPVPVSLQADVKLHDAVPRVKFPRFATRRWCRDDSRGLTPSFITTMAHVNRDGGVTASDLVSRSRTCRVVSHSDDLAGVLSLRSSRARHRPVRSDPRKRWASQAGPDVSGSGRQRRSGDRRRHGSKRGRETSGISCRENPGRSGWDAVRWLRMLCGHRGTHDVHPVRGWGQKGECGP
jgi:hypothetical protein